MTISVLHQFSSARWIERSVGPTTWSGAVTKRDVCTGLKFLETAILFREFLSHNVVSSGPYS
jgi:hypothetical protein